MNIKLYALSTCGWCRKTKAFLDDNDVEYELFYVDLMDGEEKDRVLAEVRKWNPRSSFPTIVVDERESVAGFKPEQLREVLEL